MKANDLISIIIPIYNCEDYLSYCLDSIVNQSYKNIEIILIDDGSTDSSKTICKKYLMLDNRISFISIKNSGVSNARKVGYHAAKGNFICFIDADDYIDHKYIETLYFFIKKTNSDLVSCNSTDVGQVKKINSKENRIVEITLLNEKLIKYFEGDRIAFTVWAKIFNKNCIEDCFFSSQKYTEDTYFMLSFFEKSKKCLIIPYDGYFYRIRKKGNALSTISEINKLYDLLNTKEKLLLLSKKTKVVKLINASRKEFSNVMYWYAKKMSLFGYSEKYYKKYMHFYILYKKILYKKIILYLAFRKSSMLKKIYMFETKIKKIVKKEKI